MRRTIIGVTLAVSLLFIPAPEATAAQDEIFLAKMTVVREVYMGGGYDYEVEDEQGELVVLKGSPLRHKVGEQVNFFIAEGAKENGKPVYRALPDIAEARSFKEGAASARIGSRYYFFGKNGRLLSQTGFDSVRDFHDGHALVQLGSPSDGNLSFLQSDGRLLHTPAQEVLEYSDHPFQKKLSGFSEGLAIVRSRAGNVLILNKQGELVKNLTNVYDDIDAALPFSEGLAVLHKGRAGYIDKTGRLAIPFEFDWASPFYNGRAAVYSSKKGKMGFIDKSGRIVIDIQYDEVMDFSDGLAAVRSGSKWGFVDKAGRMVVEQLYDEVAPFSDGVAVVRQGDAWGAVDKAGRVAVRLGFSSLKAFSDGVAPARENNQDGWTYVDKAGKFTAYAEYDEAWPFSDGVALVVGPADEPGVRQVKYIDTEGQSVLWFYSRHQ